MHYFDSDSDSAPTTATNNSIANANLSVAGDNTSPQHALAIEPRVLITEPLRSDLSLPAPPMPMHRFDSESDSAPTSATANSIASANLSVAGDSTSQHALAIESRVFIFITEPRCSDLGP